MYEYICSMNFRSRMDRSRLLDRYWWMSNNSTM